eukprot:CAMPEP_0185703158 /NCGR_PEP_ID=MMETSP1164-20130828/13810_1 /TAXON_ID=1104430 /ORGANISM="Chrysoreinhardia sp, Strain CCMP2950" /LENGTH=40 /DNA_ID= /DNA_START= /DNA_END= /DNA_ORIENTATION=
MKNPHEKEVGPDRRKRRGRWTPRHYVRSLPEGKNCVVAIT